MSPSGTSSSRWPVRRQPAAHSSPAAQCGLGRAHRGGHDRRPVWPVAGHWADRRGARRRARRLGDELVAHSRCGASAGLLRQHLRLGARVGPPRAVRSVAGSEASSSPSSLARTAPRFRRTGASTSPSAMSTPLPSTPPGWAVRCSCLRSTRRACATRSSLTRRAASSRSAAPIG